MLRKTEGCERGIRRLEAIMEEKEETVNLVSKLKNKDEEIARISTLVKQLKMDLIILIRLLYVLFWLK